jgi:adenylate cyclase
MSYHLLRMPGYIAVVDDEEGIRDVLKVFLEDEGYRVSTAANTTELLKLAWEESIDAFIVDIEIRGEDGIDLCRRIRAIEAHARTPILCITGNDSPDILLRAFNSGADDFLQKPMNMVSLLARLRIQLQKTDYFSKLERARLMMQRYLSPRVAMLAEEYSETGKIPAPEERLVAICFTDIRGFTSLSESMDPVELFASLSAHLRDQIETVYRFGGYVDKFNGDGLMAVFDGEDMVQKCCLCALQIMDEITRSNSASTSVGEKFPIGIGIHTGRVVIGNIGSETHLDHSAVGTNVNLAARLCGYAQPETIIVSDAVRQVMVNKAGLEFLDPREVHIRGVSNLVKIYRLVSGKPRIE